MDEAGNLVPIQEQVLINEQLPSPIFSPQAFLSHKANAGKGDLTTADFISLTHDQEETQEHFKIFHDRAEWHDKGQRILTMNYDQNYLPRITLFKKGTALPTLTSLNSVLSAENKNLSTFQKRWIRWHIKLGHLSFERVKQLAIGGLLDEVIGLESRLVGKAPHCASCAYGKQCRLPDKTTVTSKVAESIGNLIKGVDKAGQRIFTDQLESKVRGRRFHTAGREPDKDRFKGTSLFGDAYSNYIHPEHQVAFSTSDTILAVEGFERKARDMGVAIESYHTDNGVYQSKGFVDMLVRNKQGIRFSGVGAKWQNGFAEGAINHIVSTARTMMIHAALHWPGEGDSSLWPMAVSHACHLHNHTPNRESGIAPIELFSKGKSDCLTLKNTHTWGLPCYILEPRLTQVGGKIPRWKPRSNRGQYLGVSPLHASNISYVHNLRTGRHSAQYHVVHDDWFETVYCGGD